MVVTGVLIPLCGLLVCYTAIFREVRHVKGQIPAYQQATFSKKSHMNISSLVVPNMTSASDGESVSSRHIVGKIGTASVTKIGAANHPPIFMFYSYPFSP